MTCISAEQEIIEGYFQDTCNKWCLSLGAYETKRGEISAGRRLGWVQVTRGLVCQSRELKLYT